MRGKARERDREGNVRFNKDDLKHLATKKPIDLNPPLLDAVFVRIKIVEFIFFNILRILAIYLISTVLLFNIFF